MDDGFRLESVSFGRLPKAIFTFDAGSPDGSKTLTFELTPDLDLEEAIAAAAEIAAADLRTWADEADELAASIRAGALRQPPTTD